MKSPSVDLDAIPKLAADDPVIIAFSARRDLCAQPAVSPTVASKPSDAAEAVSGGLQITITISPVKAK